jgi:hypothetical protein
METHQTSLEELCSRKKSGIEVSDAPFNVRNASRNAAVLDMPKKVLGKRELNSYRNLPGLVLDTASLASTSKGIVIALHSEDSTNISMMDSNLCSKNDDSLSLEFGKRRRVQHDYSKLSKSGYIDDTLGKRYPSSTSSTASDNDLQTKVISSSAEPKTCYSPAGNILNGGSSGMFICTYVHTYTYVCMEVGVCMQASSLGYYVCTDASYG